MIKKELIEHLERGKKSTKIILEALLSQRPRLKLEKNDQDLYKLLDHHSLVVLDAFDKSISLLNIHDHAEGGFNRKRKMNHVGHNSDSLDHSEHCKSEESAMQFKSTKDTRRSYRRSCSKNGGSRVEEVTHVTDDGFSWRKYGQKDILNSNHPRQYYRCTHKYEQKCQAIKKVQQISDNPSKYRIMYNGFHTCNNKFNATIDLFEENSSSILLSFGSKDTLPQNTLNNPSLLFPISAFPSASQKCSSFKEDMPSTLNKSIEIENHCSSSSNDFWSFEGQAITNEQSSSPSSKQTCPDISVAENCSLTTSSNDYMEEDYVLSYIMANFEVLQDV